MQDNQEMELPSSTEQQMLAIYEQMQKGDEPAKKEEPAQEAEELDNLEGDEDEQVEQTEQEEVKKVVDIEPPHTWTKEQKEAWLNVPDEHKELLKGHYDEMNRGFQEKMRVAAEAVKLDKQFKQIFPDETAKVLKQQGYTPISYVNQLVNEVNGLRGDPINGIKKLMATLKVDPKDLGLTSLEEDYDDDYDDEKSLKVKKLEAELAQYKQAQHQELAARKTQDAIELFFTEQDENGQPAHPYVKDEEVQRDILAYVQRERQLGSRLTDYELLVEAYTKSPTAKRLSEQPAKQVDNLEERRKIAAQKKRAGVHVSSSAANGTGKKPPAPKNTFEAMMQIAGEKGMI